MAPTVGPGTSSLRSGARPYTLIGRQIATGRMIATGSIYHIQTRSYVPASAPITHAVMLPIGGINLYVGFTGASDPADIPARSILVGEPVDYDNIIGEHANDAVNGDHANDTIIGDYNGNTVDHNDGAHAHIKPIV